jgi:hypothetical protein
MTYSILAGKESRDSICFPLFINQNTIKVNTPFVASSHTISPLKSTGIAFLLSALVFNKSWFNFKLAALNLDLLAAGCAAVGGGGRKGMASTPYLKPRQY